MGESIKKKKPFYKKMSFYVLAAVIIAVCVFLFVPRGSKNDNPYISGKEYSNEKVDINGMSISEACSALREKGWTISSVSGVNGVYKTESSDCSDTNHTATRVTYYKQYSEDDKTPTCEIIFNSDIEYKKEDSGSSSGSSSSSSNSSNTSWKEVLKDYEAWVDEYVAFMKKYKNASSSEAASMLSDYSKMLSKQAEWANKIDSLDDNLSGDDLQEYIKVTTRCASKMAEVAL